MDLGERATVTEKNGWQKVGVYAATSRPSKAGGGRMINEGCGKASL